jgi:alcohol dehydrogenase class IV
MALAALLSGMTLTSAGLGAVHGFAAPLGANFPAPHGTVCAALLPHVLRANINALRDAPDELKTRGLSRFATVGRRLANDPAMSDNDALAYCPRFTSDLARDLAIPSLHEFGLTSAHVPEMVRLARKASSMRYNPLVLSDEALATALQKAIEGP